MVCWGVPKNAASNTMLVGRDWFSFPGASAAALDQLRASARVKLPESYFALLSHSNGGEGPLPVQPFNLCLYPVEEVIEIESDRTYQEFFPELFVVGGKRWRRSDWL
jgi:hypothetical protein